MSAPRDSRAAGTLRSWLRGIHVSGFWVLMLALLVLAVVILAPTLHLYLAQQQKIGDLRSSVAEQKQHVKHASSQLARWNDPSFVRSQVRDRFYYVVPGETSYLVIDDRSAADKQHDTAPVSKSIQATESDWLDTLLVSTVSAGLEDTASAEHGKGER